MSEAEAYFVALSPLPKPGAEIAGRVAEVMKTDPYNARLMLAGELPRVVARFKTPGDAAALAGELKSLGLPVIALAEAELHPAISETLIACKIQPGDKEVTFSSETGETRHIEREAGFLILEGISETPGTGGIERPHVKQLNVPLTLLVGIPINKKVKSEPVAAPVYERFLRAYIRDTPGPVVEIRMGAFDYSCLGAKKGLSSTVNFRTLAGELQALFPGAVYDNRLTRCTGASTFPLTPQETLEQNSRLIYLFYAAASASNHP